MFPTADLDNGLKTVSHRTFDDPPTVSSGSHRRAGAFAAGAAGERVADHPRSEVTMFGKLVRTGVLVGVSRYAWRNRERLIAAGRSAQQRRQKRR
jgi:hypothetical protein